MGDSIEDLKYIFSLAMGVIVYYNPVNKYSHHWAKKIGRILNEGFFYKEMSDGFCQAAKKKWP